jgi:phage terminase large subunit
LSGQPQQIDLPEYAGDLWEPYRHVAWHGGRGGGKSYTVATALVLQAMERHERVLCGREIQKSIRDSSKRLLDDAIDRLGVRAAFQSTDNEIRGPNDSLFLFSGIKGNANGIRSIEGVTTFWGDEAQAFSQSSIDSVEPTIRRPGSRLIWTWNPDLETDPVDAMFRGNNLDDKTGFTPPPNSIVREINYTDNPWFPDVLRESLEYVRGRDYDKYLHIWEGEYRRNSEARVFKNWRVEEFDSPPNVEYRMGADFGFSIDPSCAVRCWIDGTQLFVDREAWGIGVEIVDLPALFMGIPDAEKFWLTADSSRPETISHLRNHGFPRINSALKGARSVEEGVEFLKSYDLVIHPRCRHLIDELTHYSYKVDSLTGQVTAVLEDKDNHVIDALRYAVEGARRALKNDRKVIVKPIPSLATGFNRR